MRIDKPFYVKFPDAPKEVETVYNRMKRREQYLYERDFKNGLVYYGSEDELYDLCYNAETAQDRNEAESKKMKYLIALEIVLIEMKTECPEDYALIYDYFLMGKKMSYEELGKRHGYSRQTANNRIKSILKDLRKLIKSQVKKLFINDII